MKKKAEILHQASQLIGQKGFEATSMRDIAEASGLEASSLYSHFASKEEILWEIAIQCAHEFHEKVSPIVASELQTKSKIAEMITAHVIVLTNNLSSAAVFLTEWRHLSPEKKQEYETLRDNYEAMFRKVIKQGVEENLFRALDEKFGALTTLSALNWTYQWYNPSGEMQPHEIGERLAEILLNGMLRPY